MNYEKRILDLDNLLSNEKINYAQHLHALEVKNEDLL